MPKPLNRWWTVLALLVLAEPGWSQPLELTPEQRFAMWKQTSLDFPRDVMPLQKDGFAAERFTPPPPAGQHPRVFISPADLPDLRQRLARTQTGRLAMRTIRGFVDPLRAPESSVSALGAKLIARSLSLDEFLRLPEQQMREMGLYLMYESFRCLVDDDSQSGRRVGEQLAAVADYVFRDLEKNSVKRTIYLHPDLLAYGKQQGVPFTENDWQSSIQGRVQHMNLALAYDHAFNFMTDAQRQATRRMIAKATFNGNVIGMALYTPNAHNWHIFHSHLGISALAIEGEDGYDPRVTDWTVDNLKTYFTYGMYESGTPNERQGKGTMNPTYCIPYQKRGHHLLDLPTVYRSVTGFQLNMMEPWGTTMVYGAWGGSGLSFSRWMANNAVLKFAYPRDPTVDLLWRRSVGEEHEDVKSSKISFHYAMYEKMLMLALLAEDFDSKHGSWQEQYASLDKPLNWFCPQRALMIARSDFTTDAMQLYMHCQQYYSAHPKFGRGKIQVNGLGRPWTYYPRAADSAGVLGSVNDAQHYAVVTIDDVGTGYQPCPMVAYHANDAGCFATADLSFGFTWDGPEKDGPAFNQGQRTYQEWMPLYKASFEFPGLNGRGSQRAQWNVAGDFVDRWLFERFPVQRAFRTAGLVRGRHSYMLVFDDFQKDDQQHLYKWHLPVQPDLALVYNEGDTIILAEREGNRRLLVRLIDIKGGSADRAYLETAAGYGWSDRIFERWHENRLIVESYSVAPDFKVLLYPHREGDPLPTTTLGPRSLAVQWPDQHDEFTLRSTPRGSTAFTLRRDGSNVLELADPVQPSSYIENRQKVKR